MEKNCIFFVDEKLYFSIFKLYLDFDFKFPKVFGLSLDLDWVLKIQDWIWTAKYDSPLISGLTLSFSSIYEENTVGCAFTFCPVTN